MATSRLVLVRHGHSARQAALRGQVFFPDEACRGPVLGIPDCDIPLSPCGWSQAFQTGPALRQRFGMFNRVIHTGYLRTRQTLEGILRAYPSSERACMPVQMCPELHERHTGDTYHLTRTEVEARYPDLQAYWENTGPFFARPPGGESLEDVTKRLRSYAESLIARPPLGNTLIVIHGNSQRALCYHLEGVEPLQATAWLRSVPHPLNCGVTVYEYECRWRRVEYNTLYY